MPMTKAMGWAPVWPVAANDKGKSRLVTATDRVAFFALLSAVAIAVVALPFAVASMAGSLRHAQGAQAFHVASPSPGAHGSTTAFNARLVSIDESASDVTLAITGDRQCAQACGGGQVLQFFSLRADPQGSDGAPPSQDVNVPADGEFDAQVVLPVSGGLGAYPFDHYRLLLGVGLENQTAGGQAVPVAATSARRQLDVSMDERLSRIDMAVPKDVTSRFHFFGAQVALAASVSLTRPLYLQALTVLIIVFIAIAGMYSVITRAFKEVVGTVGVVVLGVWGVRTLLVGGYPPDSTSVDLILVFLILVLLIILMVRGLLLMWRRATGRPALQVPERAAEDLGGDDEYAADSDSSDVLSDIA